MLLQLLLILCYNIIFFSSSVFGNPGDYIIANTLNGKVRGIESLTYFQNKTSYVFRGIPFAKPPINDLRFKAPLPANNWSLIYDATYPRNVCVQTTSNNTVIGSEDCLYLNIYTTKLPSKGRTEKLPCIVWIHGGSFSAFSGDLLLHGADRFLNNDVMVVSLNYRLNIFGFLSTNDSASPGNYGLKDNILALQWVKENIEFFGGNPNDITIMGESAGAVSVHWLVLSDRATGLFHKAIAQSGDALSSWSQSYFPKTLAFAIGNINGIVTTNTKKLVQQLRQLDAYKLEQSVIIPTSMNVFQTLNGLPFGPVIEEPSEEAVLSTYCYEKLKSGNFSRVPILLGFTSEEGRFVSETPWYYNLILLQAYQDPSALTPNDMNTKYIDTTIASLKIKEFYLKNGPIVADTNFVNYVSDSFGVRPLTKSSQLQSKYCPVYLYRFAFTGGLYHDDLIPEGVSHAEDLQFFWLFSVYSEFTESTVQTSPDAILTAIRVVEMWTNFAKTGNPTPYRSKYVNVKWPVVNSGRTGDLYYLDIDKELTVRKNYRVKEMNFWQNLYNKYGRRPFNTY